MIRLTITAWLFLTGFIPLSSQESLYDALFRIALLRDSLNYSGVIQLAGEVLERHNDYKLFIERGEAKLRLGLHHESAADFSSASRLYEGAGSFGLARLYAAMGDPSMAMEQLEVHMNSRFKKGEREILGDGFLKRIENSQEWRAFWRVPRYSSLEKMREEVVYQISIGRIDEADRILRGFTAGNNMSTDFIYATAIVNFNRGEFVKVVSGLEPLMPSGDPYARAELLLIDSYIGAGNYRSAISLLSRMISDGTAMPELLIKRAASYYRMSDNRRAMADLERLLALYSYHSEALLLASQIELQAGNSNEALRYLNRLIDLKPGSAAAFSSRGNVWLRVRNWNSAIADFAMALDLDPYDAEIWLNKGIALLSAGKREEACHDFHMALRYGNRTASRYINSNCIR